MSSESASLTTAVPDAPPEEVKQEKGSTQPRHNGPHRQSSKHHKSQQAQQPARNPTGVSMHLSDLKTMHVTELVEMGQANEVENANRLRKQDLIFALLKNTAKRGDSIYGDGTLEVLPDGFGFLRSPDTSYLAGPDDIYVSPSQIRRFNLHTGDSIQGEIRTPKDGERYFALVKVDKVNGEAPENAKHKILF